MAFRVERKLNDGSVVIVWRLLSSWDTPQRVAASPLQAQEVAHTNPAQGARTPPPQNAQTAPGVMYKVDAVCTKDARNAGVEGAVILSAIVSADGIATDIQVTRGLGKGLDERAIEALRQWQFKPATKNGEPAPKNVSVEIAFRCLGSSRNPK